MKPITLDNLTKRFGDVVAVDGLDLEIGGGEFLVIVGPSGCGKSTTLRTIAGLEEVTEGSIRFGDENVTDREPKDRNVAMVFQNYALYPHMTAERNMSFGMQSSGSFTDREVDERVQEAAETLGITDLLDRKPNALSGGERQRVAIGRALVRDPDVLLLDEPLSNLDAKLRVEMRTELAELQRRLGVTAVYVTHDQTEAMTLGDRVAVMNEGEIQQVDEPQTLYDYPGNLFVARFIGSPAMNTVGVDLRRGGGGWAVEHDAFRIDLPDATGLSEGEAVLGCRPGDIHRTGGLEADHAGPIPLTVSVTEPLGESLLVYGSVGDDELTVQLPPRDPVRAGDTLQLACEPDRLHLYDGATGELLYHSDPERRATDPTTAPAGQ